MNFADLINLGIGTAFVVMIVGGALAMLLGVGHPTDES